MAHPRQGESIEDIDQSAGQDADPVFSAHKKAVGAECDTRQPEADQDHQILKPDQLIFRNKNRGKAEGITDHIFAKRSVQIPSVSCVQRKCRQLQRSGLPEIAQYFLPPFGKTQKLGIMLTDAVCLRGKSALLQKHPHKNRRHQAHQHRISQIIK